MLTETKTSIGLIQFIDFTLKGSGAQSSMVRKIKHQDQYHPAFDYWKTLRDGIVRFHREKLDDDFLFSLVDSVDPKKTENYKHAVKQYLKFIKGKDIEWFEPGKANWNAEDLNVRSSPELGLKINGELYLIKLYFKGKKDKVDKRICKDALTLMHNSTFDRVHESNTRFAILNVQKSKIIMRDQFNEDDLITLESQAVQFMYIWNRI